MTPLLNLSFADIGQWLGSFWWPFVRITTTLWVMPITGDQRVPPLIRLILGLLITALIVTMVPSSPSIVAFSLASLVLTVEQLLFGLLFGLCIQILFNVMTMAGQILSMQAGLAMATMNDPSSGSSSPIISQLMLVFSCLLFLGLNGHLVAIEVVIRSFQTWPVGSSFYLFDLSRVIGLFGWSFGAALMLVFPAVISMLMVNLTFGVMNRTTPSLNIISLGFPMTMLLGLYSLSMSVGGIPARYSELAGYVLGVMGELVRP